MEENKNKIFKEIIEWCGCIFIALIIAFLTRFYIGAPTIVKQESMYPTLQENERLWISRIKRISEGNYERGDIITFEAPSEIKKGADIDLTNPVALYNFEPESIFDKLVYYVLELNKVSYIKRIIAVEGDRVQIIRGKVFINGTLLKEEYLPDNMVTKTAYFNDIIVPEGCVYVMGDNRDESVDSRIFGCIPIEKVEGKVIFRYWPLSEFEGI